MGFSGGGASSTRPHTHDSTILQDGGSLNFDNITQGGAAMTAGAITYSDGAAGHMQVLTLGGAGETLTVNTGGTAPEWATGAIWQELCNVTTNGASSINSGAIQAKEFLHIQCTGVNSQTAALIPNFKMTFNNDTGANYASIERNNNAGSGYSDRTSGSEVLVQVGYAVTDAIYFEIWVHNTADYDKLGFVSTNNNVTAGAGTAPDMQTMNFKWANTVEQIDEVNIVNDKGDMDWRMVILGHN